MFEDWKQAWRDAVENFEREVRTESPGSSATRVMRSQIASARGALGRLDLEIDRAQAEAESEREAEQVCIRRQGLAAGIDDAETARIAGEYAVRHAERAAIYERKTAVLRDERALLLRDLESMETEMASHAPDDAAGVLTGEGDGDPADDYDDAEERKRQEYEIARLRREKRDRAADERLEELKRRMRS
ncbi:MAG TPA: hypothetical protein VF035_07725 [Longimicrobiales bacterium]